MRRVSVLVVLLAVGIPTTPAIAGHGWGTHWRDRELVVDNDLRRSTFGIRTGPAIGRALESWAEAGVVAFARGELAGGRCEPVDVANVPVGVVRICASTWNTSAWATAQSSGEHYTAGLIGVAPQPLASKTLRAIACHELGHVLGLDHRADAASCMNEALIAIPDAHDLEELVAVYGHVD